MERPVIAILAAHGAPEDLGTESVEVEVIECQTPSPARVVELESVPDEDAAVLLARALILVDSSVGVEVAVRLRAAAPAGVAVADLGQVSPAALVAAISETVVCVGTSELSV